MSPQTLLAHSGLTALIGRNIFGCQLSPQERVGRGLEAVVGGAAFAFEGLANLPKAERYEYHHIFPEEFMGWFDTKGISIDAHTYHLPQRFHKTLHRGAGGGWWNEMWDAFIGANPGATTDEIWQQATTMMDLFGMDKEGLRQYPQFLRDLRNSFKALGGRIK
jgi:hypothetical protein